MTLGLGDRPCWAGVLSPPSSPVSLPVSKGVEITLTAWWRQTTKERFELCLSGCFFFLVLAGNRRHPHGTLWRVERTGYTRIFKAAPNSWGARHYRIELIAHCYMSSLGQPQGHCNTCLYPPSLSTRTLSGPSSQGIRTQQEGWAGLKWPVHLSVICHQSPWRVGTVPLSSLYSQHLAGAGLQLLVKVC